MIFDLDATLLEENYPEGEWHKGYSDIQQVMKNHRFKHIQGSVFLGEGGVQQAHATLALQDVAIRYAWFEKCVANVQFYDLADYFSAQFIVADVTKAREAFEFRIDVLRRQLIEAGLPLKKVSEMIGEQKFSLQDFAQDAPNV